MPRAAAVLFDLDGTLVDSAPDLAGTANDLRVARGLAALPYAALRPHASSGARGMLGAAFASRPADPGYAELRDEFLAAYAARMLRATRVFDGVEPMLQTLAARGIRWGIVTNKSLRLAEPLVAALGLLRGAAVLVAGDTTPHTKPHPAPLLAAARRLEIAVAECIYIGDDLRDVQAAAAAGMPCLAAAWGYLGDGADVAAWGAAAVVDAPADVLKWLELA